ncbi:MAG: MBL fold metallo-hydrolase [Desulfobacterales bacterium]|nr:MBL fold metallo-hydrolase [Desulfobacterales bacterium]MCP4161857.1 MBL fold metallo-hydrolase [Deltaproteobacteria bacterium]
MTKNSYKYIPDHSYSRFKHIRSEWFDIYEITKNRFIFFEPRHCEQAISNLVIGENYAALIDTGCGIGNLKDAVKMITDKSVIVINTHTHSDHIGNNRQFEDIAMLDHPLSRKISSEGVTHETLYSEILDESLIQKPWPQDFNPENLYLPPFEVTRWLKDGDFIDLGNVNLEVIVSPGEAPDHICLLDRNERMLFCGDILLKGPIWTHLEGGSLKDLLISYKKLLKYIDSFDYIMPSHNETYSDKSLLLKSIDGAEKVLSGQADYQLITDQWGKRLRKYDFGEFSILTLNIGSL